MDANYGGVIWTKHSLDRLNERGVNQGDAWATWSRPQNSKFSQARGGWVFDRIWGDQKIEVVAKKNAEGKWLILSAWSQPVHKRQPKQHSAFWSKLVKTLFRQ